MAATFPLVERWVVSLEDDTDEPVTRPDTVSILDRIKLAVNAEPDLVVALFKRSLALLALCAEVDLPEGAFEDGRPCDGLLVAVSRAPVQEIREEDGNSATARFDPEVLLRAYREALN